MRTITNPSTHAKSLINRCIPQRYEPHAARLTTVDCSRERLTDFGHASVAQHSDSINKYTYGNAFDRIKVDSCAPPDGIYPGCVREAQQGPHQKALRRFGRDLPSEPRQEVVTWQDQFGFIQANEISGMERVLVCAGQTSVDADGRPLHDGDMSAQVSQAFDNLEAVLGQAGFALADVVRLNYFVTDTGCVPAGGSDLGGEARRRRCKPATTLLGIVRLAIPTLLVEIEATTTK